MFAAVGLDALARRLEHWPWQVAPSFGTLLVIAVPSWALLNNFAYHDRHAHRFEDEYFNRLFVELPANSVVLAESYPVDHMFYYKLLAERRRASGDVSLAPCTAASARRYARRGQPVFAFERCRGRLEPSGLRFSPAALRLPWPTQAREAMHVDLRPLIRPLNALVPATADQVIRRASAAGR